MLAHPVTHSTKAEHVERYMRESIRTGAWSPGERLPTESELMSVMGVGRSTLREALNVLHKDGLITRKQGQGTFVSTEVRIGTIVMVVKSHDISGAQGYWTRSLAEEAKRIIEGAGYRFLLLVAQGETSEERAASVNIFEERTAADIVGVILTTGPDPLVQLLDGLGISVVSAGSLPVDGNNPYTVYWDLERFIEISVGLLKKHGHDDFAVMMMVPSLDRASWEPYDANVYDVMVGALQRTCDFSLDRLVQVPLTPDFQYDNAYDVFTEWWSRPNRPKAMFFMDDALFDVASRAMLALSIDVPRDLAVITDANFGREFHFPARITRVGWDPTDVVSAAWEMLHSLINGVTVHERIVGVSPAIVEDSSLDVEVSAPGPA